jgi:hypothetical protein
MISFNSKDDILQFPNEIFEEILHYVPNFKEVSLTCKRFYEISCIVHKVTLKLQMNQFDKLQLDDDELYDSMLQSSRKFDKLKIENKAFRFNKKLSQLQVNRLAKVIDRFNSNIKTFEIIWIQAESNFVQLLNTMPHLTKITLNHVMTRDITHEQINLPKLREIESIGSSVATLDMFKSLTPNVLKKLKASFPMFQLLHSEETKLFENQQNIEELEVHSIFLRILNTRTYRLLDLNTLKLSLLEIQRGGGMMTTFFKAPLDGVIEGQDHLKTFKCFTKLEENKLKLICNYLKSLEILAIECDGIQSEEFADIVKLKNLKQLHLCWCFDGFPDKVNKSLLTIKSESLTELSLSCNMVNEYFEKSLIASTLISIATNCPQLKCIRFSPYFKVFGIGAMLQKFPKIEFVDHDNKRITWNKEESKLYARNLRRVKSD